MSEENDTEDSFLLATSFGDLDVGEIFDYLSETYRKISSVRAINVSRNFEWFFKSDTEINQ